MNYSSADLPIDNTPLYSLDAEVIFFPVRHHSPAAARLLRQLIHDRQPAAILIEGPSDFNDRLHELFLLHTLPIAIYSYLHTADDRRRGAFYPFCIYSPEWQALQTAHELNIPVEFIDLPWADRATDRTVENAYSDEPFKRGDYIATLCQKLGVEDFDALWDVLFEIDPELTLAQYLERCHQFCWHMRASEKNIAQSDRDREAFMLAQIKQTRNRTPGQILVVTGGFHSSALYAALDSDLPEHRPTASAPIVNQGIALTPYSYDRLDNLTGYQSGMPNPGFYHAVWKYRTAAAQPVASSLLQQIVQALRQKQQIASTADLIAVQTLAQGLADLRGHAEIWRSDLIDGVIGGLVKEDLTMGSRHPFLEAIYQVFRGDDRGRLAPGTPLPPLVQDLHQQLHSLDLFPTSTKRSVDFNLTPGAPTNRTASALFHTLRILAIQGIQRTGGTDFTTRSDLTEIYERWEIHWTPNFDSSSIEAAIYGASVTEATIAKLQERATTIERDAEQAALLLLDAALAGVDAVADQFYQTLIDLIHQESDFLALARSLSHLLYLYRYDEILGTQKQSHIAQVLVAAFERGLWLFDSLGTTIGEDDRLLKGIGKLMEAYERSGPLLTHHRSAFVQVLDRVSQDTAQLPILRGGAIGALWLLGETSMECILVTLRYYAQPEKLGDFLTGIFHLARETTQREPELVLSIDAVMLSYSDDEFLEALPSLRLAFTYFTPREKQNIAKTLIQATNPGELTSSDLLTLPLGIDVAAEAIAFESQLFQLADRYGIRGGKL
ncbi:MAG: hypothetical protein RLZZ511_3114 [Cyanobacteriota bacterium]|jgi:Family of unknown function (DUF5682)